MLAIIYSTILMFQGPATESSWQQFREFFNEYFNYPGFELWQIRQFGDICRRAHLT